MGTEIKTTCERYSLKQIGLGTRGIGVQITDTMSPKFRVEFIRIGRDDLRALLDDLRTYLDSPVYDFETAKDNEIEIQCTASSSTPFHGIVFCDKPKDHDGVHSAQLSLGTNFQWGNETGRYTCGATKNSGYRGLAKCQREFGHDGAHEGMPDGFSWVDEKQTDKEMREGFNEVLTEFREIEELQCRNRGPITGLQCTRFTGHAGYHFNINKKGSGEAWQPKSDKQIACKLQLENEIALATRREQIATAIMAAMCGSNYETEKFYDFPCQASGAVEAADALIKMLDEKSQAIKNQL